MKFLVAVVFAFLATSAYAESVEDQDSPIPTDLEVPPKQMSRSCKNIFAPLQNKTINQLREGCKEKYPGTDDESYACKDRCILEHTYFVDPSSGNVMVAPFKMGMEMVQKADKTVQTRDMVKRIVAGFEWCHDQARTYNKELTKGQCGHPVYMKYGLCLWEMVNKLCLGVNNRFSNTDEPWGKGAKKTSPSIGIESPA